MGRETQGPSTSLGMTELDAQPFDFAEWQAVAVTLGALLGS